MKSIACLALTLWLAVAAAMPAIAEVAAANIPSPEEFAKDNKLFLNFARKALKWDDPMDPVHIGGPLYYVGTRGLSSYIFATSEGLILHNTGMPESGPMIADSIRKLGFRPEDIKIIINGHGHSDHAGAFAYMKELSGAQLAVMEAEVPLIESGGKTDFHYGKDWRIMGQPPVKADRILRDGDIVSLGEVKLTAHHTPGHTRGATTWTTTILDGGKAYDVVFVDGAGFNPGYRIARDPSYPGINGDYRRTLHRLEMMAPDIPLGPHAEWFDVAGRAKRAETEGIAAFVDPEAYRRWVAAKRRQFEDQVDRENGIAGD